MIRIKSTYLSTFAQKSRGLLGTKTPKAVHFHTRWGIHTFGMHYPIDVIVLDTNGHVVKCTKSLSPNNMFFWHPKYELVVELPIGTIKKLHITTGSVVAVQALNAPRKTPSRLLD